MLANGELGLEGGGGGGGGREGSYDSLMIMDK